MRMHYMLKTAFACKCLVTASAFALLPFSMNAETTTTAGTEEIIGHGDFKYRVNKNWVKATPDQAKVINCHSMVEGNDGLLYMVTDHPANAVVVFKKDGTFVKGIGEGMKGGHGIAMIMIDGEEHIIHVDCGWEFFVDKDPEKKNGSVNIMTKDGKIVRTLKDTRELGLVDKETLFQPTDVVVTPDNDILVLDGYSSDKVLHYKSDGAFVKAWGGPAAGKPEHISNGHGISLDLEDPKDPILWISSRNENKLKQFTLDGKYLGEVNLDGAYAGQAVFKNDKIYTAVCWSKDVKTGQLVDKTGFVLVLDRKTKKVLSAPGGMEPVYTDGKLNFLQQDKANQAVIHGHDVFVDEDENIFLMEWNADRRFPLKLERIK